MLEITQSNDACVAVRRSLIVADVELLDANDALAAPRKSHGGRGSHDPKTDDDNAGDIRVFSNAYLF